MESVFTYTSYILDKNYYASYNKMKQKITDIQPHPEIQAHHQLSFNQKPSIVIHSSFVEKFGLRIGLEIEAQVIKKIIAADEAMRAKNYALGLLREDIYSKTEMTKLLEREGYGNKTIEVIIKELIYSGHIRDRQFAEKWIKRRLKTNPRGKTLLKRELIDRGVDSETAEKVVAEVTVEAVEELALKIAQKQVRHYKKLPVDVAKRRLHGYLARRGFESDVILQIIHQVL